MLATQPGWRNVALHDRTGKQLISAAQPLGAPLPPTGSVKMVGVATNGAMALERLEKHPYDLLVSDVRMPVLDAEGLYLEVERRFPALHGRIIFLTGDVTGHEKQAFLERVGAPTIVKPCNLGELKRLVNQVLADRAA